MGDMQEPAWSRGRSLPVPISTFGAEELSQALCQGPESHLHQAWEITLPLSSKVIGATQSPGTAAQPGSSSPEQGQAGSPRGVWEPAALTACTREL